MSYLLHLVKVCQLLEMYAVLPKRLRLPTLETYSFMLESPPIEEKSKMIFSKMVM